MNRSARAARRPARPIPDGPIPLVSCAGTAYEAGQMLGAAWKEALCLNAAHARSNRPWWQTAAHRRLVDRLAPHLPDLFRGMARGAGLAEETIPVLGPAPDPANGCTSFAVAPSTAVDRIPIAGQNKDVPRARGLQLQVLRLQLTDAPSVLTLTYPGWLFGHGFVRGGLAVFRNSLFVPPRATGLPYAIWGLLALHCPSIAAAVDLTKAHGLRGATHVTLVDGRGTIRGLEHGAAGSVWLRPARGIYTHANCVLGRGRLRRSETGHLLYHRADSLHRRRRLHDRLAAERGRLTVQTAIGALSDHDGYPVSVCRHESNEAMTAASVIVEPTRGRLYATRGPPCQTALQSFSL